MCSKLLAIGFALAMPAALPIAVPARAADDKSSRPGKQPVVSKMTIVTAGVPMVYYSVQNGTPRLNAVYRLLAFAENEFTLVMQLQELKFDFVRNERIRELQSSTYGIYAANAPGESTLKTGLSQDLAAEGTPDAAVQAIRLLEKAEIDAANELKLLSPQDQQKLQAATQKMHDFVVARTPNAALPTNANNAGR